MVKKCWWIWVKKCRHGKGGCQKSWKNADVFYIWSFALVALLPPCVRPTTNKLPFFLASFWDQTQGFTHLRVIRRIFFFGYFYVSISSISRRWYHQTFYDYHKGQTISKANYVVLNSPKKTNVRIIISTWIKCFKNWSFQKICP